ncbi:hypothetical protein CPU12_09625 [Malaciobacter molluscorum LMG 25693]|uniref:Membrane protein n=1 Tax=Malaciobacter molluscorum LMG 25693 TaxID=870501 RepID=A0A2G1DGD3_9BACT|nr:pentapeptide repeat-containing protein [Malaciobacter molluscorum]AXX91461.1 putative membrane protein [Malaciobacter molluscorum LMG 25693]PHO17547.1 hypothetical protein CPU12_09625 [Malaciobacter molluscorum LMG 25693]
MQYKLNQCKEFYNNKNIKIKNIELYEDNDKSIEINTLPDYKFFNESQILFEFCIFKNTFNIENGVHFSLGIKKQRIEILFFKNCIFENNIRLFNELIEYELIFENCIFLEEVNLEKSIFEKHCGFSNSIFFNGINLKDTSFDSRVSFRNITLNTKNEFNLEETYINNKVEFIRICSKDLVQGEYLDYNSFYKSIEEKKEEKYLNVKNRETARIIKDSFEQQNNIIEANKYYALEMKKREEEELTKDLKEGKNFFEWLVFKVHGISSNHSQDWLLALFWIISFSFSIGTITNDFEEYHISFLNLIPAFFIFIMSLIISSLEIEFKNILLIIFGFISYGLYSIISYDFNLYNVANHINPFSVMNSWDNITFSELIFKVIIAYLIYQFIISIRQNTRRK